MTDDDLNEMIDEAARYRDDGIKMADFLRVMRHRHLDDD